MFLYCLIVTIMHSVATFMWFIMRVDRMSRDTVLLFWINLLTCCALWGLILQPAKNFCS